MTRRCVICGCEESWDKDGNPNYHYPKSKKEARIWQQSLNAQNVTLDALQKYCCVCIEHIPDLVDRTNAPEEPCSNVCQCPTREEPNLKPPVNVLLMTGASLPTYCGKACTEEEKNPETDTDICVLESNLADCGTRFPDIDDPEFTVMRTPMPKTCDDDGKAVARYAAFCNRSPDDLDDLSGEEEELYESICTEVLVLGQTQKDDSCLGCDCGKCRPDGAKVPVCPPECNKREDERLQYPPCGCECEKQTRRDLTQIIKKQARRINELEQLLEYHSGIHEDIVSKVGELNKNLNKRDKKPNYVKPVNGPSASEGNKEILTSPKPQATSQEEPSRNAEPKSRERRSILNNKTSEAKVGAANETKKTIKEEPQKQLQENEEEEKDQKKNPKNKAKKGSLFKIHGLMKRNTEKSNEQTKSTNIVMLNAETE